MHFTVKGISSHWTFDTLGLDGTRVDYGEKVDACGIRFIAYYNHSCNGNDDVEWRRQGSPCRHPLPWMRASAPTRRKLWESFADVARVFQPRTCA